MIVASPILMCAPKERPLADQRDGSGSREEQVGQHMAHFRRGQRNEWRKGSGCGVFRRCVPHFPLLDTNTDQEGIRQEHEGDVAIPAEGAAHFIVIEPQSFGGLQILFDVPTAANGSYHGSKRGVEWGPDQIIGHLVWIVQTTTKDEPMAPIGDSRVHDWQASPVKEALPFGALTGSETVPIASTQRLPCDARHIAE